MVVYVLVIENGDEILECRTYYQRESASRILENWAEENGISLNQDETDALIYTEEDENLEEYISRITDDNIGECRIIPSELEE